MIYVCYTLVIFYQEKNQYCSALDIFLYLLNSDFHEGRGHERPVHYRTSVSYYYALRM